MFESVLFFALFVICVNGNSTADTSTDASAGSPAYDPTKWDYCQYSKRCKVNFHSNEPPTGCPLSKCDQRGSRSEIELEKFMEFRKLVVEEHNYWRDYYASGKETRGFSQPVANMVVMNYDVELEHLARCWGRGLFRGNHDGCRWYHTGRPCGQSMYGFGHKYFKMVGTVKTALKTWYDEVKDMKKEQYEHFHQKGAVIGHFAQLVWAGNAYVGCARIYTSDVPKENFVKKGYVSSLICNYYVPEGLGQPSNVPDVKIFEPGPPCSKCWAKEKYNKCNSKYTSLCGELEPIPTEKPYKYADKSSSTKLYGKITLLICTYTFLMLL